MKKIFCLLLFFGNSLFAHIDHVYACLYALEVTAEMMEKKGGPEEKLSWISWCQDFEKQWLYAINDLPETGHLTLLWDYSRLYFVKAMLAVDEASFEKGAAYLKKSAKEMRMLAKILARKETKKEKCSTYTVFEQNPALHPFQKERIRPYLMPKTHELKALFDSLFTLCDATDLSRCIERGGFQVNTVHEDRIEASLQGVLGLSFLFSESIEPVLARASAFKELETAMKRRETASFLLKRGWLYPLLSSDFSQKFTFIFESEPPKRGKTLYEGDLNELYFLVHKAKLSFAKLGFSAKERKWFFLDASRSPSAPSFAFFRNLLPKKKRAVWDSMIASLEEDEEKQLLF